MSIPYKDRARGCLIGLAVGDALGSPTEGKTPETIQRQWGRVTDFLNDKQGGSDDTEHALFNARLLLAHGPALNAELIAEGWKREIVKGVNAYKGAGFSEMLVIRNLRDGLMPPASGQHLHAWSDGLAMRVAPFAIVAAGRPEVASELAAMDGSVTHAGEGIIAGQAVAAAIAVALVAESVDGAIDASLSAIPEDSWTHRAITKAVQIGTRSRDVWSGLEPLHRAIVPAAYFWPDVAPEAVALAFGIVAAARGSFSEAVLGGVNIGRDADTIAAIAGAICGALHGVNVIPTEWRKRVERSRGICLAMVAGMELTPTADALAELSERWQ
ncbi:MAG: ADP-ribosylglycohydrolase family protein [Bacteroidetes bacterium]|jgi:ADP-ribosylglycohydrolase|nr:ADP-ribosylglycohydrolase family protein [Bacteroidota bacterium]